MGNIHRVYGVSNSSLTPTKEHVANNLTLTNIIMMMSSPGPPSRKTLLCKKPTAVLSCRKKNTKNIRICNDARAWPQYELCSIQVAVLYFNGKKAQHCQNVWPHHWCTPGVLGLNADPLRIH